MCVCVCVCVCGTFNKFSDFFVQAFKIVVDSWKFSILWDDWPIFMISGSNEQLQQQLEYTQLKPDCHRWWISKRQYGRQDTLEERYAINSVLNLEKMPQKRMECFRLLFDHLAWIEHQFSEWHKKFKEGRESVRMMKGVGGVRKPIHQSWLTKGLGLGSLCWGFKGVQEEIPPEEASTLQIGSMHFHQDNTPVHNSILVTDYLTKILSLPIVQTFLPVTFGYSLSSEVVVMRQLRRWKRLWRRSLTRSYKRTSMEPCRSCWNGTTSALQPEEITSKGTRVSCVYYQ